MTYDLIFHSTGKGTFLFAVMALGITAAALGCAALAWVRRKEFFASPLKVLKPLVGALLLGPFSVYVWDGFIFLQTHIDPSTWQKVEGPVQDAWQDCSRNDNRQGFTVNGVVFEFSESEMREVLHTSCKGGFIENGMPVRIHYVTKGSENSMMQLEVGHKDN